ncbi:MAG TPA: valine--tRNA ligase [Planctomycetota bacterium]
MDFATRFDPKEAEPRLYKAWEEAGRFTADAASSKEPFTMVIPPPNVTGSLHIGHALNNTIQDILARWKRLEGFEVLWLPGTDHAGIATQAAVEKSVKKDERKSRHELGREEFLKRVWAWKEKYGATILNQLKRLGSSCDWSRTRFTMDEGYSRAIRHVFVSLFKKGLIYRGLAIVNWCPRCLTALSDLEVEKPEEPPPGKLWHLRYPVKGEPGKSIVVATTRPETMLGDTGVAVNPSDERYQALVGKTLVLPLLNREIPVVADAFVDAAFGTGAVKVTPAHDPNDFDCGKRAGLKAIVVMDPKAVMNENAGPYRGLDRFEARKKIVADLEAQGFLVKVEEHPTPVGTCYRCATVVEPFLSEQWFVAMKTLAAPAVAAVKGGDVRFVPDRWSKVYLDWMENIRDWCISRQIWWGHRIPVWYCPDKHVTSAAETPTACLTCGSKDLKQDEDVLDTWFSSALWPFATLGWPDETPALEKFYPGQVLVTSRDIINLWVARMIVSGLEFRGEKPFSDVIIHATIMDDDGKRQSKSKGTGIDPLDIIDVHGADPLRFALAWSTRGTQDLRFGKRLSVQRVEMARNFVTKLWNAARFVAQKNPGLRVGAPAAAPEIADRWILSRLSTTIQAVSAALEGYEFGEAAELLYKFVWDDFCDWYIELSKRRSDPWVDHTLATVLDASLRLLHPFIPFVTEEIWQKAGRPASIMTAAWPEPGAGRDAALEKRMALVFDAVRAVRDVRTRNNISPKTALDVVISSRDAALLKEGVDIIRGQANVAEATIGVDLPKPKFAATVASTSFTVYVPLEGKINVAEEVDRTKKEIEAVKSQAAQAEKQLSNEEFRKRKPELAAEIAAKLEGLKARRAELETHLRDLGGAA